MRKFLLALSICLAGCAEAPSPLSGIWHLLLAKGPLEPAILQLSARGSQITGTGTGPGVDAPVPYDVNGTVTGSTVTLDLGCEGAHIRYTAVLTDTMMSGTLVYDSVFGASTVTGISYIHR